MDRAYFFLSQASAAGDAEAAYHLGNMTLKRVGGVPGNPRANQNEPAEGSVQSSSGSEGGQDGRVASAVRFFEQVKKL